MRCDSNGEEYCERRKEHGCEGCPLLIAEPGPSPLDDLVIFPFDGHYKINEELMSKIIDVLSNNWFCGNGRNNDAVIDLQREIELLRDNQRGFSEI